MNGEEERPRYRLEFSDAAEAEADAVYLWMGRKLGQAYANRWYRDMWDKTQNLTLFPHMGQRVPGRPETVRSLLHGRYRLLYLIVDPGEGEEEGVIRVLRVSHAAGRGAGEEDAAEQP